MKKIMKSIGPREQGQILLTAVLSMTVLIGIMGLAIDAGLFFDQKRLMQTAADSASLAAGLEVKRNPSSTNYVAYAWQDSALNGFSHGQNGIDVQVNRPPTSGYSVGDNKFVEVIVSQPQSTHFMRVLNFNTVTVRARAVAGPGPGSGCLFSLSPTASGAVTINGTASLTMPECGMVVNSNSPTALTANGGGTLTADSISVTGGYSGSFTPTPTTGVPPEADPLGDLVAPTWTGCTYGSTVSFNSGGTYTLDPGVYCGGIKASGNGVNLVFNPGLYILQGVGLDISGSATGTGITFYIDSGGVKINGTGTVNLAAPTSGTYEGILFFQNRNNTSTATFNGGSNLTLEGALYFKSAEVKYAGGNSTSVPYTVIVADTVKITGNSGINGNYSVLPGGGPIKRISLAE